ncbi:MAG: hypothetical protein KKA84_10140 [Bacteroidetes bacterium]|nr:hypothetical protein [Bacteroidota bacterium]
MIFRILYYIARADFLERTRRYSFLITIGVVLYVAYLSFPPIDAKYLVIGMGDYRGIYNSAWVGSSIALLCSSLLSLAGFYLIKNAIERDYSTGVGQIIATTPLTKWEYLIGKMISNTVFLMSMVIIISLGSLVMQLYRGESSTIQLLDFWAPILITTLPVMALVSAVSLFFESVKILRGGIGNVIYYFLFMFALMASMGFEDENLGDNAVLEPFGINLIIGSMQTAAHENFSDYNGSFAIGGSDVDDHVETFEWDGVEWTSEIIFWRFFWIVIAIAMTSMATFFFKGFDTVYGKKGRKKKKVMVEQPEISESVVSNGIHIQLSEVFHQRNGYLQLLYRTSLAELKLMLKGLNRWWYFVSLGLGFLSLVVPMETAKIVVPLTWIWPLLIWSQMGNRELKNQTNQYIFSAPSPLRNQLPAIWLAGFLIAIISGYGWVLRLVISGEFAMLAAWFSGAMLIPSLALAAGIWTNSSKLFEILYFMLWYMGPMHQTSSLDFIGITQQNNMAEVPFYFFFVAVTLIILSIIGRRRQLNAV